MARYHIGLIVNPIAGMGGSVGLKGTDGDLAGRAKALGALPVSPERAIRALSSLKGLSANLEIVTCSGEMGEVATIAADLHPVVVTTEIDGVTTAEDTRRAVTSIIDYGIDLMLFVGGDGTAQILFDVIGKKIPILGVPAGVKMHSAVFAATPRTAGDVARIFLMDEDRNALLREREIMDREADDPKGSPKLFGFACTPQVLFLVPQAKASGSASEEAVLATAIQRVARILEDDRISLIGPGTTMLQIKRQLGLEGTLLGVDVTSSGQCLETDVNERDILELIKDRPARIVVSIVGGQGFLFGRGNQQLSAEVIKQVGLDNIIVVSSLEKLTALPGNFLLVDTGNQQLDDALVGFIQIIVSNSRTVIFPIKNPHSESSS